MKDSPHKLSVEVSSFSYRKGLPTPDSEHGGGFIFDCRLLPNPGRDPAYAHVTGKDREVIDYLIQYPEVDCYLNHVKEIISQAVDAYIKRGYSKLSIAFGCTGGQHRSVYCAEEMARFLGSNADVSVNISHREQDK